MGSAINRAGVAPDVLRVCCAPRAVPLRRGAHPAVLSVYREAIGCSALTALSHATERGTRPPVDARLLRLFAAAGFTFMLIRLTILAALSNAGPDITAAITPVTPVATLLLALALRMETLHVRSRAGAATLAGLAACTLSTVLMGVLRGPRLFGAPPAGAHAPAHVPAGVAWMLANTLLSAIVQLINKQTLATFPTVSTTAAVAAFAVLFLIRACAAACLHMSNNAEH